MPGAASTDPPTFARQETDVMHLPPFGITGSLTLPTKTRVVRTSPHAAGRSAPADQDEQRRAARKAQRQARRAGRS
jgi:hypothetical protein